MAPPLWPRPICWPRPCGCPNPPRPRPTARTPGQAHPPGTGTNRTSPATETAVYGRGVALLAGAGFLAMAAFVGMETTLAFVGQARYGWDAGTVGLVPAAAGLAMAGVQAGLVARLSRRWGEARVAALGAAVMAACLPVIPLAPGPWPVVAVCLLSAGHGLLTPTLASLLAAAGPDGWRGARLGIGQSAAAGGRIFGPAAAGLLFDLGAVLPYLAGAVMAGLALTATLALPATRDRERPVTVEETREQPG
ncbi:MFS transporter [Nonomuraea sp. JJY05]|uniref:MFS transporter n=1 Tax=Nonomuraea sp. JJY05 TaxID=3350255 RepID=UPI00373E5A20